MIKRNSIILFYMFTFIFTIILGGTGQALCANFVSKQYQTIVSLVLAEIAPTFGALFICLCSRDWSSLKNMNWNPFKNAKSILWLLLSFVIPTAIVAGASIIMSIFGKTYIPNGYSYKLLIITVLLSLIGCVGEEIGWRGFMLPSFNKKYPLLSSAVLTGILWGAWHFGKLISFGVLGYVLFILLIIEFSIIMSWIYSKSNANMACMVLFHLGINLTSILLLTGREGIIFYTIAIAFSGLICWKIIHNDKKMYIPHYDRVKYYRSY